MMIRLQAYRDIRKISTVAFSKIPLYLIKMVSNTFPRYRLITTALVLFSFIFSSYASAPRENPYDILGKVFAPFWGVLLTDKSSTAHAFTMTFRITSITGRLPKQFQGAVLRTWAQFPDKLKFEAPVLGETMTVCRDGLSVWATPGKKMEFLLSKFAKIGHGLPKDLPISKGPLPLPVTAQQAVFLPALFTMKRADVAEVAPLNGEDNRLITAGIMPELAQAIEAEDFLARLWVAGDYKPRRLEIVRRDFTCTVDITELRFLPSLPKETWQIPAGVTDVYHTTAHKLQAILFVVMNSLQLKTNPSQSL